MRRTLVALWLLLTLPSAAAAEEIVARARTWSWEFSIIRDGDPWSEDCQLWLKAERHEAERQVSLKREHVYCALFGPVHLIAADSGDFTLTTVIVEAARGGDGDHSGPILEFFHLDHQGFRKLGEQQLFDASYVRREGQLAQIQGKVVFSFCDVCDGPEASDPDDNIYVPVRITFGCAGICVKPTGNTSQRQAIRKRFLSQKGKALVEKASDRNYRRYVQSLERELNQLLGRR